MKEETEAELLAQIFAAPEDDAPRLVYSDWLIERGRPRGELIQLQHLLGSLIKGSIANGAQYTRPRNQPPGWEAKVMRERTIFGENMEEWIAPVLGGAIEWTFRRGFIDSVVAGPAIALRAALLFEREPVRSIWLRGEPTLEELKAFFALPFPVSLRTLNLSLLPLGKDAVQALALAPHLRTVEHLMLVDTHLDDTAVELLARSTVFDRLSTLSLNGNPRVTDRGFVALARAPHLPSLKVVRTKAPLKPETRSECSRRFTVVS